MDTDSDRQQAHDLLDKLDVAQLGAVMHLLEIMTDPVASSVANAPAEEEEITTKAAGELDAARASLDRGQGIRHEEVLREFGVAAR